VDFLFYLPTLLSSFTTRSERVFDVVISQDGTKMLAVDLVALAGARTAVTKSFTVAASFSIHIFFFGVVNYGLISAIEVHLAGDVPPSPSPIVKPLPPVTVKPPTPPPVSRPFELFINSGGAGYIDSQGREWVSDNPYFFADPGMGSTHAIADREIADTVRILEYSTVTRFECWVRTKARMKRLQVDDKIYCSERYGSMFFTES
jgi:hypothetical protein